MGFPLPNPLIRHFSHCHQPPPAGSPAAASAPCLLRRPVAPVGVVSPTTRYATYRNQLKVLCGCIEQATQGGNGGALNPGDFSGSSIPLTLPGGGIHDVMPRLSSPPHLVVPCHAIVGQVLHYSDLWRKWDPKIRCQRVLSILPLSIPPAVTLPCVTCPSLRDHYMK